MSTPMLEVAKSDANNYCEILTLLGMEEEGDPVRAVRLLVAAQEWLLDSFEPPEAAIRAGGNCIGVAELTAMVQEELHPDDLALRIWYAMRPVIANTARERILEKP